MKRGGWRVITVALADDSRLEVLQPAKNPV